MSLLDMIKQSDPLVLLAIGVALVIIILFKRISALRRTIDSIEDKLSALEEQMLSGGPIGGISLESASGMPSNAIIAAITAAVNQYQIENS